MAQIRDNSGGEDSFTSLLKNHLLEQDGTDDLQEYLIYMDYLLFDSILQKHNIASLKMKTVLCAESLLEEKAVSVQIQKVVDTLTEK